MLIKNIRKVSSILQAKYLQCMTWLLLLINGMAFADNNPFPNIDIGSGDVVQAAGSRLETTLKYATLGVGGLLVIGSIGVLIQRLREDSQNKDHGNMVTTFIFVALGLTFGFILIAIGWKAFSAQIQ